MGGDPIEAPDDATVVSREKTEIRMFEHGGRLVVTWLRLGRTCVLSGDIPHPGVLPERLPGTAGLRALLADPARAGATRRAAIRTRNRRRPKASLAPSNAIPRKETNVQANVAHRPRRRRARGRRCGERYGGQREESFDEGQRSGRGGGVLTAEGRPSRQAEQGFFVDLAVRYPSLAASGADFQLTGPATHQNQAPFPAAFAPGVDEKLPGLIVLLSTTTIGAKNAQNLANVFNLTGFTNQKTNEIWDTWIVGTPSFGKNVRSVLRVAVAADKNKDGIYNDAPAVVPTRTVTAASTRSTSSLRGRLEHRGRAVRDSRLSCVTASARAQLLLLGGWARGSRRARGGGRDAPA